MHDLQSNFAKFYWGAYPRTPLAWFHPSRGKIREFQNEFPVGTLYVFECYFPHKACGRSSSSSGKILDCRLLGHGFMQTTFIPLCLRVLLCVGRLKISHFKS